MRTRITPRRALVAGAALALVGSLAACGSSGSSSAGGSGGPVKIGLVTKTNVNPYFVFMRQAAQKEAAAKGAQLIALAGKFDGDNEGQVNAIEELIAKGVKGILITPNNSTGVLGAIKQAREKGILVIALDTATDPASAVDATYATDNFQAGQLEGQYAKAALGNKTPKLVMLDGTPGGTVDDERHNGFLKGFGLSGNSPEIVGTQVTHGAQDLGQQGMENELQAHPDVNVVYTINEPAARGAYEALEKAGKAGSVVMGTIDGSCQGIRDVQNGVFGADVMQFPAKMAQLAVDDVVTYAKTGKKPSGFHNTGAQLITAKPVPGVPSKDPSWGLQYCWG